MPNNENKLAFKQTIDYMRAIGGSASERELFNKARAALRLIAPEWPGRKQVAEARQIAEWISRKYSNQISRPQPKLKRSDRKRRDDFIVEAFVRNSNDVDFSFEELATRFDIGKSTAHAIIKRAGLIDTISKFERLTSPGTMALLRILQDAMPSDGVRLVEMHQLCKVVSAEASEILLSISEINTLKQPIHIQQTKHNSPAGKSNWLVIERGKHKKPHEMLKWADLMYTKMIDNTKFRNDHRVVLNISDSLLPPVSVFRDAAVVAHIVMGTSSLHVWRHFIETSSERRSNCDQYIAVDDTDAILTVINGAARLGKLGQLLPEMHLWLPEGINRSSAERIFAIAGSMIADTGALYSKFEFWAEETLYRQRVEDGSLKNRSVTDIEMLRYLGVQSDDDQYFNALFDRAKLNAPMTSKDDSPVANSPQDAEPFLSWSGQFDEGVLPDDNGYIYGVDDDD